MAAKVEEVLARTALFSGLDPEAVATLAAHAQTRRYRRGAPVFVQGERGSRCYIIVSGTVKIATYTQDGRETVLAVLGPGDVLGDMSLFDETPRSANAAAVSDCELLSLDGEDLRSAIREHPDIGIAMLGVLADRLRTSNESIQDSAFLNVPARLARRLAELASMHGVSTDGGVLLDMPLSQEALAGMVGASRESVNKALSGLRRAGLVAMRGRRYVVPDVEKLRARAR